MHTGMTHGQFRTGQHFWTATGEWLCTDVGTRVIAAIKVTGTPSEDLAGPPYSVAEEVFDEYDFGGCSTEPFHDDPPVPDQPLQT